MKKFSLICALFVVIFMLSSCSDNTDFSEATEMLDSFATDRGGKVVIYMPQNDNKVPEIIISLYGSSGIAPDELELTDFAGIWYSQQREIGDYAIFHAINATDTDSIIKMCQRRATTLKLVSGTDMEIYSSGHYVIAIANP